MIQALLELPANLRDRLARSLETGMLRPPFTSAALGAALGAVPGDGVAPALDALADKGLTPAAIAAWIRVTAEALKAVPRPELVWTGPEVPGLHARDTRMVFDQMLGSAERSLWASTYAYFDGPKAFGVLAARMDATPELEVTLLLNVGRTRGETRSREALVDAFAERFWNRDWPGTRRPRVFYDPRGLEVEASTRSVLHAKALIQDEEYVLVTSANFTEAALERNIEVGLRVRDTILARQLERHFSRLIESGELVRLQEA